MAPPVAPLVPPYAAYLRVYEPLAAFPEPERSRWADYAARSAPRPDARGSVLVAEQRTARRGLLATPQIAAPDAESDDAFVIVSAGTTYLCPLQMRLRCWVALEELLESEPDSVVDALVPRAVVDQASVDFARWRAQHGSAVPRILTSTWHVPLWWFVAFGRADRLVHLDGDRSLVYRTPMVEARRRAARAAKVLARTVEEGPVTAGVDNLGRWLEEWHPHGLVELDYGGLAHLLSDEQLRADESAADAAAGLAALAKGEADEAVECYRRLLTRWRDVQALEHAN